MKNRVVKVLSSTVSIRAIFVIAVLRARAKINSHFTALKLCLKFCYRWRGGTGAHTPPVRL